ncbi:MAG TPA: hypothetical protein VLE89_04120 [Chlamydiales bacterium]|nr:hypothetical protein [Chlamydiales bacterium]
MSLFYSELLELLRKDEPGLRKNLGPMAADEPAPLSEIIEGYGYLFGEGGVGSIERRLMESLSMKEFGELGLLKYFPRIYRGLPRVYRRERPGENHIKKNFTNLQGLKRLAMDKACFSLYKMFGVEGCRVCLFTWVMQDGLGDFMAGLEVKRILEERLGGLEVDWVVVGKGLPKVEGCIVVEDPLEVLERMRECDLILQMPTLYPKTGELMEAMGKIESRRAMPRMEILGEYGFLESSWFHPKSGNRSLGLHFLEKGILVRGGKRGGELKNELLKEWLIEERRFYLAYLTTRVGGAVYLHALLKSLEGDEKGIDICVPDLGWFIDHVEKQNALGEAVIEGDFGVQSIEVYFEGQIHSIGCAPRGKVVRLLCPGRISNEDFQVLVGMSGDFIAVRGDQSFSEVVSANRGFFYDGREHARYFMKDLLALAENRIWPYKKTLTCFRGMNKAFLHNLPADEGEWVDETFFQEKEPWLQVALEMGESLKDPETIAGYKMLNRVMAEELSANDFICHLVQRGLCHQKRPEIAQLEMEQISSFTTFIETLRKAL